MDNGALLVIEEQELVKKTVEFIKTGEITCEKCYFHDHRHCPWDCDDGYYVEHNPSNWHTGTPTEDGLYVVYYLDDHNSSATPYEVLYDGFLSPDEEGNWIDIDGEIRFIDDDIVRWQKIDEYKETEK